MRPSSGIQRKPSTDEKRVKRLVQRGEIRTARIASAVVWGPNSIDGQAWRVIEHPAAPEVGVTARYEAQVDGGGAWLSAGTAHSIEEATSFIYIDGADNHPAEGRPQQPSTQVPWDYEASRRMSMDREAQILQAMAFASLDEQNRLMAELQQIRGARTASLHAANEVDLGGDIVTDVLTPVLPHAHHTAATDWLGERPTSDLDVISKQMRAQANEWFINLHEAVRGDAEEYAEQARGMAMHTASWSFPDQIEVAADAFVRHAAFLHRTGGLVTAEGNPTVRYDEEASDEAGYAVSQLPTPEDEEAVFENFAAPIAPENAAAVAQEDGSADAPVVRENQQDAPERTAAAPGQSPPRRGTATQSVTGGHGTSSAIQRAANRHFAESKGGQTCAQCGAAIERDPAGEEPRTWHHADGDKHDHEAKPAGRSESSRRRAILIGEMEGRSYHATCPNPGCSAHGVGFVHDDLAGDVESDGEEATCPECETPLVWDGRTASRRVVAYWYCNTHNVAVGVENRDTHAGCKLERREKKDSSRRTAVSVGDVAIYDDSKNPDGGYVPFDGQRVRVVNENMDKYAIELLDESGSAPYPGNGIWVPKNTLSATSSLRQARALSEIATDIRSDWREVNFVAAPYIDAMAALSSVEEMYGAESGRTIVAYFLSNAAAWRGEKADKVKAELRAMLGHIAATQETNFGALAVGDKFVWSAYFDQPMGSASEAGNPSGASPGGTYEKTSDYEYRNVDTGSEGSLFFGTTGGSADNVPVWKVSKLADSQNGQGESNLDTSKVEDNDDEMWPWAPGAPGTNATDVANVATPGGESGYPQPGVTNPGRPLTEEEKRKSSVLAANVGSVGDRHTIRMPYSEVCMHMQVAGRDMECELIQNRYFNGEEAPGQMVQIYDAGGRPFSAPITTGEAGWGMVGSDHTVTDFDEKGWHPKASSLHTAIADGQTSYCRLCGRELQSMEHAWYALSASAPKRDVGPHGCVPARTADWPGEFNAAGNLVPGSPGGGGGQYDAPAGTIYDAGGKAIKVGSRQVTARKCSHCEMGNHSGTNGTPGCSSKSCSCSCGYKGNPPGDASTSYAGERKDWTDTRKRSAITAAYSPACSDGQHDDCKKSDCTCPHHKSGDTKNPFAKGSSLTTVAVYENRTDQPMRCRGCTEVIPPNYGHRHEGAGLDNLGDNRAKPFGSEDDDEEDTDKQAAFRARVQAKLSGARS